MILILKLTKSIFHLAIKGISGALSKSANAGVKADDAANTASKRATQLLLVQR